MLIAWSEFDRDRMDSILFGGVKALVFSWHTLDHLATIKHCLMLQHVLSVLLTSCILSWPQSALFQLGIKEKMCHPHFKVDPET